MKSISIRCAEKTHALIEAAAKLDGRTVTDFCRWAAIKEAEEKIKRAVATSPR